MIRLSEFGRRDDFELDVLELGEDGLEVVGSWSRVGGVNYTRTWGQKTEQIATSMAGRTFRVVVGLVSAMHNERSQQVMTDGVFH